SYNVQEEKTSGAIKLFKGGAQLHQRHHVETDVDQTTVQKHRGDQPIPLMLPINWIRTTDPQAVAGFSSHSPQNAQPAGFAMGGKSKKADTEHKNIGDQQRSRDRRIMVADQRRQLFADGGERESEVSAAYVAARGVNADQRAARGAELGACLLIAAEKAASGAFHIFDATLPLIGNPQCACLLGVLRVSIIPELH